MDPVAARLDAALENARRFFVGQADVQQALRKLARLLDEEGIAYAVRSGGVALLPLEKLVELKLASGLSAPHRLKDLADVLELIRAARLPEDFAERRDESVRRAVEGRARRPG